MRLAARGSDTIARANAVVPSVIERQKYPPLCLARGIFVRYCLRNVAPAHYLRQVRRQARLRTSGVERARTHSVLSETHRVCGGQLADDVHLVFRGACESGANVAASETREHRRRVRSLGRLSLRRVRGRNLSRAKSVVSGISPPASFFAKQRLIFRARCIARD